MRQLAVVVVTLLSVGFYLGCERDDRVEVDTPEGPAERTGEQIDRTAERTGEAMDRAAERTGEALDRTAERTGEAMDRTAERTQETAERTGEAIDRNVNVNVDADVDAEARTAGARVDDAAADTDHQGIYQVLGETVEAAVKVGTFDDLVERFAADDRARFEGLGADTLNAETQPFIQSWQQRHGEFDIQNPAEVLQPLVRIESQAGQDSNQQMTTARVIVQARNNQPEFTLNMVKDTTWRIDLPETVNRENLRTSLASHLRMLHDQQATMPQDQVEAQREVAHHVLAALGSAAQGGAQQPGQQQEMPAGSTGQ